MLLRTAHEWWSVLQEKQAFVLMVFGESQRNPDLSRRLGQLVKEGAHIIASYLETRVKAGELRRNANLEVAARVFLNGIFMFFLQESKQSPPLKRIPPEVYLEETVEILLRGLER